MKTDESIATEAAFISEHVGPTTAEWYTEACQVEVGDHSEAALWKCRVRRAEEEHP